MPPPSSPSGVTTNNNATSVEARGGEKKETEKENNLSLSLSPEQVTQREKKISSLRTSIAKLESQIAATETQLAETRAKLKSPNDATKTVQKHIRLLHSYNEIRDIGQGLLGLIADARGVRHVDVQREFGVGVED
ncbi:hypothetical protein VTN77DRAFT_858 [Rasamsonia byssochlamydoides]|uniref:uncharacterized protein n=1 Tax=Rasamsonia byssochlamydoides TaxID=89139 RepID=UPI00374245BC